MTNEHLIPEVVLNIIASLFNKTKNLNEHYSYLARVEAIRDICNDALAKLEKDKREK